MPIVNSGNPRRSANFGSCRRKSVKANLPAENAGCQSYDVGEDSGFRRGKWSGDTLEEAHVR